MSDPLCEYRGAIPIERYKCADEAMLSKHYVDKETLWWWHGDTKKARGFYCLLCHPHPHDRDEFITLSEMLEVEKTMEESHGIDME